MFWISWFCSLLLVKWPIFGQLFGLISQKATTGWFSFWLFSTYLCMYFMKLKWFFMDHDLFETEASQPLWQHKKINFFCCLYFLALSKFELLSVEHKLTLHATWTALFVANCHPKLIANNLHQNWRASHWNYAKIRVSFN